MFKYCFFSGKDRLSSQACPAREGNFAVKTLAFFNGFSAAGDLIAEKSEWAPRSSVPPIAARSGLLSEFECFRSRDQPLASPPPDRHAGSSDIREVHPEDFSAAQSRPSLRPKREA